MQGTASGRVREQELIRRYRLEGRSASFDQLVLSADHIHESFSVGHVQSNKTRIILLLISYSQLATMSP